MNQQIPDGFDLRSKCLELEQHILKKHPQMPILLREIHSALKKQPENITLLSEENIAILVAGLEQHTNTYIAASISSKKKDISKSLANKLAGLSDDDF